MDTNQDSLYVSEYSDNKELKLLDINISEYEIKSMVYLRL